jgi:hypothetical protein
VSRLNVRCPRPQTLWRIGAMASNLPDCEISTKPVNVGCLRSCGPDILDASLSALDPRRSFWRNTHAASEARLFDRSLNNPALL